MRNKNKRKFEMEKREDRRYLVPSDIVFPSRSSMTSTNHRISWADLEDSDDEITPPKTTIPLQASVAVVKEHDIMMNLMQKLADSSKLLKQSKVTIEQKSDKDVMANLMQKLAESSKLPDSKNKVSMIDGRKTIIVKNLPRDIKVIELYNLFEMYGAIRDIFVPKNKDKNSPYYGTVKGFATILFVSAESAAVAVKSQLMIRNNRLFLEFAKEDRDY